MGRGAGVTWAALVRKRMGLAHRMALLYQEKKDNKGYM